MNAGFLVAINSRLSRSVSSPKPVGLATFALPGQLPQFHGQFVSRVGKGFLWLDVLMLDDKA